MAMAITDKDVRREIEKRKNYNAGKRKHLQATVNPKKVRRQLSIRTEEDVQRKYGKSLVKTLMNETAHRFRNKTARLR